MKIKHSKQTVGNYTDIAQRLRDIRLDARLTQKEMAKLVGLTPGSIGAMENGLYTPNFDVLRSIRQKLNVPYEYIIDGIKTGVSAPQVALENKELKAEIDRLKKMVDKLLK